MIPNKMDLLFFYYTAQHLGINLFSSILMCIALTDSRTLSMRHKTEMKRCSSFEIENVFADWKHSFLLLYSKDQVMWNTWPLRFETPPLTMVHEQKENCNQGYSWYVYYHKMCMLRPIGFLKDRLNTDSVLVEKVTLQLCHFCGKSWN